MWVITAFIMGLIATIACPPLLLITGPLLFLFLRAKKRRAQYLSRCHTLYQFREFEKRRLAAHRGFVS